MKIPVLRGWAGAGRPHDNLKLRSRRPVSCLNPCYEILLDGR